MGTNPDGSYITRNIEDVQVGDWVLARDQNDPDAEPTLEQVTEVFQREVTSLRVISYQDASGNVETISTTDEHPFYAAGRGWVAAADLRTGDVVTTPTGGTAIVVGNVAELLETPILVYNLEVASGHTYFVEDGQGAQTPVWVHNTCKLTKDESNAYRESARNIWQKLTGLRASWSKLEIHHRIPLEWSHLFPKANPNRIANLVGLGEKEHNAISTIWATFKISLGREPTASEVMRKALDIDKLFGRLFKFLP